MPTNAPAGGAVTARLETDRANRGAHSAERAGKNTDRFETDLADEAGEAVDPVSWETRVRSKAARPR